MKDIKVGNYSVYSDGFYGGCGNFTKLYNGIRVSVDDDPADSRYMHFSIRTRKQKECIWKRGCEKMEAIVFTDSDFSVTCVFENEEKNKTPHTLRFSNEEYGELKENIPAYMEECGCRFDILEDYGQTMLLF